MTDPITLWREDGAAHGWTMPRVPGWWRWWGVRHVRWAWISLGHDESYPNGRPVSRRARWMMFGIWHGLEGGGE
jgi:hypothetical protein